MLSKKDLSFLSVARAFATESDLRKKHGAVVVRGGSVVGVGRNKHRNDPAYLPEDVVREHTSYHAEEIAIRQAGENTKGATIYIARVNNQGEDRNSRPCLPCSLLIKEAQIKKIVYTTEGEIEYVR
jgi:deoxycytidylate deaminase